MKEDEQKESLPPPRQGEDVKEGEPRVVVGKKTATLAPPAPAP